MSQNERGLKTVASQTFELHGEVYHLVTFLNQTLKNMGLCFGLSKRDDKLQVTVYQTDG